MSNLHAELSRLADTFTKAVLATIRGASLQELVAETGDGLSKRPRSAPTPERAPAGRRASGRLKRRSAEDIGRVLDQIVALVRKHKSGLRAEQIRAQLGMQAKEMPRILKEGLSKRKLKSRGQKRATTYFAA